MKQRKPTEQAGMAAKSTDRYEYERPVGRFGVRAGDLVEVADPHHPRLFLAEVAGAYQLGRTVYVRLCDAAGLSPPPPRLSTKAKNIQRAWRLAGRRKTKR